MGFLRRGVGIDRDLMSVGWVGEASEVGSVVDFVLEAAGLDGGDEVLTTLDFRLLLDVDVVVFEAMDSVFAGDCPFGALTFVDERVTRLLESGGDAGSVALRLLGGILMDECASSIVVLREYDGEVAGACL